MEEERELIRLLVADSHALFRHAVRVVLEMEPDLEVVAEARTGTEAVVEAEQTHPDVALLHAGLRDVDTPATIATLRERLPACRVIVMTEEGDHDALRRSVECGAAGYLTKDVRLPEFKTAIRSVHSGDTVIPPSMLGRLLDGFFTRRREQSEALKLLAKLSRREQEVLRMLVDGAGNDDIGGALLISPQTARTHIQRVIRKLGVHSRLEAAMLVTQSGVVDELPEPPASPRWETAVPVVGSR